jgi:hypothetical protein
MTVRKIATFTNDYWQKMKKIADKRGYTMSTVILHGMAIYFFIHKLIDEGNEVKIVATNKETGYITEVDVTHDI